MVQTGKNKSNSELPYYHKIRPHFAKPDEEALLITMKGVGSERAPLAADSRFSLRSVVLG